MTRVLLLTFWPWVLGASAASASPEGRDAKSAPLLSLKADMSKSLQGVAEHNATSNGTSCHNCSLPNHTLNQSLEDLVKDVLQTDMNQSSGMPDPVGDSSEGSLGQNLEFHFLKVAQLETEH